MSTDSTNNDTLNNLVNARKEIAAKFLDTLPSANESDFYHLTYYSAFDEGTVVKFSKKGEHYFLSVKNLNPSESANRLTQYVLEIDKYDWERLEGMMNEFEFWTAEPFKINKGVLDGHYYFLEGSREVNKEQLRYFIARKSAKYDKIEALCDYIIQYQKELLIEHN